MSNARCVINIWKPSRRSSEVVRTVRVRGRVKARVAARRLLPVHRTTNALYHHEMWKMWTATITLPGGRQEGVEAEIRVMPSVGEVGVW